MLKNKLILSSYLFLRKGIVCNTC